MKILTVIFLLIIITDIIVRILKKNRAISNSLPEIPVGKQMTLESKLEFLADCGLKLASPFTLDDIVRSWGREDLEKPGFNLTLTGLAMTEEEEPWRPHCVNLLYLDTECIEDHGDYKRIVERMADITQGAMHFDNVKDYVDIDEGKAWFSFTFQGKEIKVNCKANDDWLDTRIMATFIKLLRAA
ncbi:MAG: hypothetical protein ACYC0V_20550, partial [Armatimonadota bacterium]